MTAKLAQSLAARTLGGARCSKTTSLQAASAKSFPARSSAVIAPAGTAPGVVCAFFRIHRSLRVTASILSKVSFRVPALLPQFSSNSSTHRHRFPPCRCFRPMLHVLNVVRFVTWGGRTDMSPHFFIASNRVVFVMLPLGRVWGNVAHVKVTVDKKHLRLIVKHGTYHRDFVQPCTIVYSHTQPLGSTTLHHSSTRSDNDADPKHKESLLFRTHLDQSHNCLYPISCITGCAAVFVNVLRPSSDEIRLHVVSVVLKAVWHQFSWTRSASSSRTNMGGCQRKVCQIASLCLDRVLERLSVCCSCVHW